MQLGENSRVDDIVAVNTMPMWENGGYFVLRQEIFDHIPENGDLVGDGCTELAKRGRMLSYPYRGFWQPADTVKERNALEASYQSGARPWMLWDHDSDRTPLQSLISSGEH